MTAASAPEPPSEPIPSSYTPIPVQDPSGVPPRFFPDAGTGQAPGGASTSYSSSSSFSRISASLGQPLQAFFASASTALSDAGDTSTTVWFLTPLPDAIPLDRLSFSPADVSSAAQTTAAKKTIAVGIVLAIVGVLIMLAPRLPTLAIVMLLGSLLLLFGLVCLVSFLLSLSSSVSISFLLLALAHCAAGAFIIFSPVLGAFWLSILISVWLMAKGAGRLSVASSLQGSEAASKSVYRAGMVSLLTGVLLLFLSHHWPFILGFLFGYDTFLAALFLTLAGTTLLRSAGSSQPPHETHPLQGSGHPAPPSYTTV